MNPAANAERKPSQKVGIPRWLAFLLALLLWPTAIPLGHALIPWAVSSLTPHYGWIEWRPSTWNLPGLIPVVFGAVILVWVLVVGLAETPKRVELSLSPAFLLRRGPYAFTRNPMYVAELGLWLGWSLFFGSLAVLIGFVVLYMVLNFIIVPREEHTLEVSFGQAYLQYKHRVPRWLRRIRT